MTSVPFSLLQLQPDSDLGSMIFSITAIQATLYVMHAVGMTRRCTSTFLSAQPVKFVPTSSSRQLLRRLSDSAIALALMGRHCSNLHVTNHLLRSLEEEELS
jgi:hypothetical protein